jgi:hypothetical protein
MFLLLSCSSEKEKQFLLIKEYLNERSYSLEGVRFILVVTEEGCPACNQRFASIVEEQLTKSTTLCIVAAKGTRVDISPFYQSEKVLMDLYCDFLKLKICNGSCLLLLSEMGGIDTIVSIESEGLEEKLHYLTRQLDGFN